MKSSAERQFNDVIVTPDASMRTITKDGYLTAPATLARAGVFKYLAGELGIKDRKPETPIAVFRSPESLAEAVDSFESQTITLDHKWTTAANWRANAVGDVRDVELRGDSMVGTLIVRDAKAIKAIDEGTSQMSNGYAAKLVHRPGKYQGEDYEYEQTTFHGNHVAIVDKARCGPDCRIFDSEHADTPPKEKPMVTRMYDGLTLNLENEHSGQMVDRMLLAITDSRKEIDRLKALTPKFKIADKELTETEIAALIAGKDGEIKTLKDAAQTPEQVHALVVARSNAIASAREMVPDLKIEDKDSAHDIRRAALDALAPKDATVKAMLDAALGTTKLADAQPAVLEVAFATISAGLKRAKDSRKVTDSRQQISTLADARGTSETDPRAAYTAQLADAWRGPQPVTPKKEVN